MPGIGVVGVLGLAGRRIGSTAPAAHGPGDEGPGGVEQAGADDGEQHRRQKGDRGAPPGHQDDEQDDGGVGDQ